MTDPYQLHNYTALSTIMLAGSPALLGLLAYLGSRLTPQLLRAYAPPTVWRDLSLLATAGALALYLWGCLHLIFREREDVGHACDKEVGPDAPHMDAFHGDFIPLRIVCHTEDGHTYTPPVVPDYINPSIAVLLLLALAAGVTSAALHRKQRSTPSVRKGSS